MLKFLEVLTEPFKGWSKIDVSKPHNEMTDSTEKKSSDKHPYIL